MEEKSKKYGNSTTRKLKDGAVTMEKLAEDVKEELNLAMVPVVKVESDTVALEVNKVYDIKVGESLTLTLNAPTDLTVTNEYQGSFDTGATAPMITFPLNVIWANTPSVEANTHYEFNIRYTGGKYFGLLQAWNINTEEGIV